MSKPRLAIGSVYSARSRAIAAGYFYTLEICAHIWIKGERWAVAVSHPPTKKQSPLVFLLDDCGVERGTDSSGRVLTYDTSRAKPRYQRTAP